MTDRVTIFGYGPVGRATAARLLAEGREVTVAQRRAPPDLPKGRNLRRPTRPYRVDPSRFAAAFRSDATPFEVGVPETALAYRAALTERL